MRKKDSITDGMTVTGNASKGRTSKVKPTTGSSEASGSWLSATLRGRLLLRLRVDKFLPQIMFFFLCAVVYIGVSIGIESVLHEREENMKVLRRLESIHVEMSCRLTSLYSVCQVEDMLAGMGSDLKIPTDKAATLK